MRVELNQAAAARNTERPTRTEPQEVIALWARPLANLGDVVNNINGRLARHQTTHQPLRPWTLLDPPRRQSGLTDQWLSV
jgi:hypothetical protein